MVYYINESYDSKSINELCNEFTLYVNNIVHEANMTMLATKYNFICENGYEMPLNEAEEQKQGFFKRMIQRIKDALKNLCDKAVNKLKTYMDTHPDSKVKPFIQKIHDIFQKASRKLDSAKSTEEAKSIGDDAGKEVKSTTEEGIKEYKFNKKFLDAIKNKDIIYLRCFVSSIMHNDPTFSIDKAERYMQHIRDCNVNIEEPYKKLSWEIDVPSNESEFTPKLFDLEVDYLQENFAYNERVPIIKKIGKILYERKKK